MRAIEREEFRAQEALINRMAKKIDRIMEDLVELQEIILIAKLKGVYNDKITKKK